MSDAKVKAAQAKGWALLIGIIVAVIIAIASGAWDWLIRQGYIALICGGMVLIVWALWDFWQDWTRSLRL